MANSDSDCEGESTSLRLFFKSAAIMLNSHCLWLQASCQWMLFLLMRLWHGVGLGHGIMKCQIQAAKPTGRGTNAYFCWRLWHSQAAKLRVLVGLSWLMYENTPSLTVAKLRISVGPRVAILSRNFRLDNLSNSKLSPLFGLLLFYTIVPWRLGRYLNILQVLTFVTVPSISTLQWPHCIIFSKPQKWT